MSFLGKMFKNFHKKNDPHENKLGVEYMVVGLGNPGKEYNNTRHNAGFMFIDYISKLLNCNIDKEKFDATLQFCCINNHKVLLLKPQTFMNNSGCSVVKAMNFYKILPRNVIIIYDDISFDVGKIRIRRDGTHGGHNGIKNIIQMCNSESFPRIKIGVGKKPHKNFDLSNWVLSKFSDEEIDILNSSFKNVFNALKLIIDGDINNAMNNFNTK